LNFETQAGRVLQAFIDYECEMRQQQKGGNPNAQTDLLGNQQT
jgi:hypothetical protein